MTYRVPQYRPFPISDRLIVKGRAMFKFWLPDGTVLEGVLSDAEVTIKEFERPMEPEEMIYTDEADRPIRQKPTVTMVGLDGEVLGQLTMKAGTR